MDLKQIAKHCGMSQQDELNFEMVFKQVLHQGFASNEDLTSAIEFLPYLLSVLKRKIGSDWKKQAANREITYEIFNDCVKSLIDEIKKATT